LGYNRIFKNIIIIFIKKVNPLKKKGRSRAKKIIDSRAVQGTSASSAKGLEKEEPFGNAGFPAGKPKVSQWVQTRRSPTE
jgi:hypothetical protein